MIRILRIPHYIKNLLIFVPLIFSYSLGAWNIENVGYVCKAFVLLSLDCSAIYIFNDIVDVEADRRHPIKCKRPIASGEVKISAACIEDTFLLVSVAIGVYILRNRGGFILILYILLNVGYSLWLKKIPIFDVLSLATCYILRLQFGCLLIDVDMSNWLYLTTLAGSLYLSLGKRKAELYGISKEGLVREVLDKYTQAFLDEMTCVFMNMTIVFYALWSVSFGSQEIKSKYLPFSTIIVITVLMRYQLNISEAKDGDPVSVFFSDRMMLMLVGAYCCFIAFCIWEVL